MFHQLNDLASNKGQLIIDIQADNTSWKW